MQYNRLLLQKLDTETLRAKPLSLYNTFPTLSLQERVPKADAHPFMVARMLPEVREIALEDLDTYCYQFSAVTRHNFVSRFHRLRGYEFMVIHVPKISFHKYSLISYIWFTGDSLRLHSMLYPQFNNFNLRKLRQMFNDADLNGCIDPKAHDIKFFISSDDQEEWTNRLPVANPSYSDMPSGCVYMPRYEAQMNNNPDVQEWLDNENQVNSDYSPEVFKTPKTRKYKIFRSTLITQIEKSYHIRSNFKYTLSWINKHIQHLPRSKRDNFVLKVLSYIYFDPMYFVHNMKTDKNCTLIAQVFRRLGGKINLVRSDDAQIPLHIPFCYYLNEKKVWDWCTVTLPAKVSFEVPSLERVVKYYRSSGIELPTPYEKPLDVVSSLEYLRNKGFNVLDPSDLLDLPDLEYGAQMMNDEYVDDEDTPSTNSSNGKEEEITLNSDAETLHTPDWVASDDEKHEPGYLGRLLGDPVGYLKHRVKSVSDHMNGATHEVKHKVKHFIDENGTKIKSLLSTIEEKLKAIPDFRAIFDQISQSISNMFTLSNVRIACLVFLLSLFVFKYIYGESFTHSILTFITSMVLMIVNTIMICEDFLKKDVPNIAEVSARNMQRMSTPVYQAHSGDEDVADQTWYYEMFKGIASVLGNVPTKVFDFASFSRKITLEKVAKLSREFKNIGDLATNVPKYIEMIRSCFEWLRDQTYVYLTGMPYSFHANMMEPIIRHAATVLKFPEQYSLNVLACLKRKCAKYLEQGRPGPFYNAMSNAHEIFTNAEKVMMDKQVVSARGGASPLVIKIQGRPDVGKSTTAMAIAEAVSEHFVGFPSVYGRNVADQFWSRWDNQFIVVYDDFGARADTEVAPCVEFLELIGAKSITPFMLNMAELERKGEAMMTAGMIILTTNQEHFGHGVVNSLCKPAALERRFDICIKQDEKDYNLDKACYQVIRVFGEDYTQGGAEVKLTLEQLVELIILKYNQHYTREYKISVELKSKMVQIIGNIKHKMSSKQRMTTEAFVHFQKWRACLTGSTVPDNLKDFYAKYNDLFGGFKERVTEEELFQQVGSKNFTILKEDYNLLKQCANSLSSPIQKPFLKDFDPEIFKENTHRFQRLSKLYMEVEVEENPCPCSSKAAHHIPQKLEAEVINKQEAERVLGIIDSLHQYEYKDVGVTSTCAFDYMERNKIPVHKVRDIYPDLHALEFYDCSCKFGSSCTKSHKWNLSHLMMNEEVNMLQHILRVALFHTVSLEGAVLKSKGFVERWRQSLTSEPLKTIAILSGIALGTLGVLGVCRSYFATKYAAQNSSGLQAIRMNRQNPVPYFTAKLYSAAREKMDSTLRDFMPQLIQHKCKVLDDETGKELLSGFWIDNYHFIVMAHVRAKFKPDTRLRIIFSRQPVTHDGYVLKLSECKMYQMTDFTGTRKADMLMIEVPPSMFASGMTTITNRFFTREQVLKMDGKQGIITIFDHIDGAFYPRHEHLPEVAIALDRTEYHVAVDGVTTTIENAQALLYNYGGAEGQCTSPICIVDHNIGTAERIIALHEAGDRRFGMGLADIVTQEQIKEALDHFSGLRKEPMPVYVSHCAGGAPLHYVDENSWDLEENKVIPVNLDVREPKVGNYRSMESNLVKTPIGELEVLPSEKAPAILKPTLTDEGIRDPVLLALEKNCNGITRPHAGILSLASADLRKTLQDARDGFPAQIFTIEEAIFGIPGREYVPSINLKTSPGWLWKKLVGGKGKMKLVNFETRWIHPQLREAVNKRILEAALGIAHEAIFEDHLKDEKRPLAKIKACKTRLFSAGPVDLMIAMKMYYGSFVEWFMTYRFRDGGAIGVNATSPEWHVLALHLMRYGPTIIDGDFSNYDGTLNREILWQANREINHWYDPHEPLSVGNQIRAAFMLTIVGALHLVMGFFYFVFGCNPSGNYLTSILNCLYGLLFFRYAYYVLKPHSFPLSKYPFYKHVTCVTFGDDNIMGVGKEVQSFFHPAAITDVARSIGMEYTSADKSGPNTSFKTLTEASFLKRSFVWDERENMYLGPLDLATILEIPNWSWKKATPREMADSCEQAIRELALHPRDVFEHWATVIENAAIKCNYPGIMVGTWEGYRDSMLRYREPGSDSWLC